MRKVIGNTTSLNKVFKDACDRYAFGEFLFLNLFILLHNKVYEDKQIN